MQHVQTGTGFTRQVARYDQAYDAVNRITRIDSSVDEASVYNYDKTGQLLTAQMTFENNEAYTYDANGNRTSGGTISNGSHKNLVTQDAKYTYLYDGENNRTRRTEKTTGYYQLYIWDHRNRLARVEFVNASGVTVRATEYRYDASDMKVAEFVDTTAPFDMANASAKWFIYDGADVVLDFARADMSQAPGATISKRYFQGPGVDQLLAQENIVNNASQSVWWILPDHLGSTRDLVTASGSVVAHFQFDSFGNILDGRENVTRYQFTGREHDSNTDLNYHRARWYDPFSGKWLSEDPIGFAAGDANVTRYVGNGVLNATDPSGLWKKSNKQHIWIAEFGDSFDGLAQRVGRNGVAKFAIRPLRPSSNTSVDYGSMTEDWNERLITPCGEYSTRYLENPPKGKGGHAAVSVGKDFDPDFRFVVGARKFFGTKNFASGLGHDTERAVRWIAGQASFGAAPLSSLWIIGHCCATCSNIGGLTQNLSAEDFQLNGRHGFDFPIWEDAVNGRLTPGFWFSQTASLRLIGCNSSNLAKSFADELLWTSANAYGTTTFAMAAFDGKSMGWSNDGVTFGGKMYTDHASYFASPNWQSHPGSTKYPF